jgi:hypothetical protein
MPATARTNAIILRLPIIVTSHAPLRNDSS